MESILEEAGMNDYFPTQVSTLIAALLVLGFVLAWHFKNKYYWRFSLPIILYLSHSVVLYGLYVIAALRGIFLSDLVGIEHISEIWSAVLRLQGIGTLGLMVFTVSFYVRRRG